MVGVAAHVRISAVGPFMTDNGDYIADCTRIDIHADSMLEEG